MEQRYNISGTHEELQLILEKEFGLSAEAARAAAIVFVYGQNQEQNREQMKEDTLWFLDGRKEEYQSSIFSTRYTICFSKAMLDVFDEILVPAVLAFCGGQEFAAVAEIFYCIKALAKNLRRIKDDECCVYFRTIQYLKNHPGPWFSAEQVMPCMDSEAVCINLDKNWQCKFRCGECRENCSIRLKDVKDILDSFCRDNVMESNEDTTLYRMKI